MLIQLHYGDPHKLYASQIINKWIKSRKMRNAYSILVGKPEGKRTIGRSRRR
jgi:hypothetical protein